MVRNEPSHRFVGGVVDGRGGRPDQQAAVTFPIDPVAARPRNDPDLEGGGGVRADGPISHKRGL